MTPAEVFAWHVAQAREACWRYVCTYGWPGTVHLYNAVNELYYLAGERARR